MVIAVGTILGGILAIFGALIKNPFIAILGVFIMFLLANNVISLPPYLWIVAIIVLGVALFKQK